MQGIDASRRCERSGIPRCCRGFRYRDRLRQQRASRPAPAVDRRSRRRSPPHEKIAAPPSPIARRSGQDSNARPAHPDRRRSLRTASWMRSPRQSAWLGCTTYPGGRLGSVGRPGRKLRFYALKMPSLQRESFCQPTSAQNGLRWVVRNPEGFVSIKEKTVRCGRLSRKSRFMAPAMPQPRVTATAEFDAATPACEMSPTWITRP